MRGNTFEWRDREQGSRDWRLLPAALCGWAASLATHAGFDYCVEQEGRLGMLPLVLVLTVPLLALLGLLGLLAVGDHGFAEFVVGVLQVGYDDD